MSTLFRRSVFIVCELPDLGLRVAVTASELVPAYFHLDVATTHCVNTVANALLALNSAANFIIYCLVGRKFRRILAEQLCPTCCRCLLSSSGNRHRGGGCCCGCCRRKGTRVAVSVVQSTPDGDAADTATLAIPLPEMTTEPTFVVQSLEN